jgi:integrase/recombinase XerD
MPRLGQKLKTRKRAPHKPNAPQVNLPAPLAANPLSRYLEQHFEWMLITGYSKDTIRARRQALRRFIAWADERGHHRP